MKLKFDENSSPPAAHKKKKKKRRVDRTLVNGPDSLEDFVHEYPIWIFHPYEPIRTKWDLTVMAVMVYVLLDIPVRICFGIEIPLSHPWEIFNLLIDCFFMVDIVFNFRTGYIEDSQFITRPRKIAQRYFQTWFWIDLFTSIPFSPLVAMMPSSNRSLGALPRLLKFMKIARMFKLLRVLKLYRMMSNWEDQDSSRAATQRLLKFLCIVFLMAHIAACMWMGVATYYREPSAIDDPDLFYGFHHGSWVVREWCHEKTKLELYLFTLYWSFTTLTTVGYGDFTAWLPLEIAWTIVVMICGTSLFGYIIGNVASLMTHEDETALLVKHKIQSVLAYMKYRDFPDDLSRKIRRHYEYSWKRTQVYNEQQILSELPQTVRTECALYIHRDTISKVPFLSELGDDVVPILVTRLKPMLASHGDVIICEGFFGNEMYFIAEGTLRMELQVFFRTNYEPIVVRKLGKGEYFAEYAVIMDQPKHPITMKAASYCDLFALDREQFQEFGEIFPTTYYRIMELGKARFLALMKELNRTKTARVMERNAEFLQRRHTFFSRSSTPDDSLCSGSESEEEVNAEHAAMMDSVVTFQMRRRCHREYYERMRAREERQIRRDMRRLERRAREQRRNMSNAISQLVRRISSVGSHSSSQAVSNVEDTISGPSSGLVTHPYKALVRQKMPSQETPKRGSNVGLPKIVPRLSERSLDINPPEFEGEQKDAGNAHSESLQSLRRITERGESGLGESTENSTRSSSAFRVVSKQRSARGSAVDDEDSNKTQYVECDSRSTNYRNTAETAEGPFPKTDPLGPRLPDDLSKNDGFVPMQAKSDSNLSMPRTFSTGSYRVEGDTQSEYTPPDDDNKPPSTNLHKDPLSMSSKIIPRKTFKQFTEKIFKHDEKKIDEEKLEEERRKKENDEEEALMETMPEFSFFVLMKLQMWKNRAQLNVAMRKMQSVENRHKDKFLSNGTRSRSDSVRIRRPTRKGSMSSSADLTIRNATQRLDAMSLGQVDAKVKLKSLGNTVADLQNKVRDTNRMLLLIAKHLNVSPETAQEVESFSSSRGGRSFGSTQQSIKLKRLSTAESRIESPDSVSLGKPVPDSGRGSVTSVKSFKSIKTVPKLEDSLCSDEIPMTQLARQESGKLRLSPMNKQNSFRTKPVNLVRDSSLSSIKL